MSYLDIDVILSEEDRVKCTFTLDAQDLGKLDKDTKTDYLAEGTELELPLWMAETLLEKNMITAELPKQYNQTMRDALQAGAASVRLFEHSFYFFEVGVKLAKDTEDKDLKRNLMQAFSGERFRNLMNHSLSSWNDDMTMYAQDLTSAELSIFNEGVKTSKDLHDWRQQKSSQLKRAKFSGDANDLNNGSKKR